MALAGTAVERNCALLNVLLDCNKNGDVTNGFVTSYQQVRISAVSQNYLSYRVSSRGDRRADLMYSSYYLLIFSVACSRSVQLTNPVSVINKADFKPTLRVEWLVYE